MARREAWYSNIAGRTSRRSPGSRRRRTSRGPAAAVLLAVALAFASGSRVPAQDDAIEARLVRLAGLSPETAEAFFERLRRAVGTGDRASACGLVAYPLAHPDGVVPDRAACEARYDAIFTVPVRRAIGRQQWKELFVNADGVMIGSGEVWFAARCREAGCADPDIRVTAVHVQPGLTPPAGKVLIACRASERAVTVEADGKGGATLRSWTTPAAVGAPALEVTGGTPTPEATGLCAWRAWSFADGATTYGVAEVACLPTVVPAPFGTVARFMRTGPGVTPDAAWCFE